MTIPMTARRDFPYAGKRLKKGQEFEARGESDAKLLAAIGHAVRCPAAPAPAAAVGNYRTRAMTAGHAPNLLPMLGSVVEAASEAVKAAKLNTITVDGVEVYLDDMDKDALHALAERLGVKVHHMMGAPKVRQALVAAQKAPE